MTQTQEMPYVASPTSPPRLRGFNAFSALRAFGSDPLGFLREVGAQGDVMETRFGPRKAVFLRDPRAVEQILVTHQKEFTKQTRGYYFLRKVLGNGLVTSEGDFWREQRRISQPAFAKQRIEGLTETMVRCTQRLLDGPLAAAAESGAPVDIAAEMMRVTLDVVSATLLGIESGERAEEVSWAMPVVLEHVVWGITHPLALPEMFPTARNRRYKRALKALDTLVEGIIAERRARPHAGRLDETRPLEEAQRGDLLDMLMEARDEETGRGMTDKQLRDEVMTMYLAGHETTAVSLAWTLWLLTQNPEWALKVQAELDEVLQGRCPTLADMGRLDVTRRVLEEGMRLYPPVWLLARMSTADHTLAGYHVPKGRLVFVSPWLTHRDPKFFADPERFDPDRFLPESRAKLPKHAYFPFSAGQRKCIGDRFALLEAQIILAMLLSRFRFGSTSSHTPEPLCAVTLRPKHPMPMQVAPRAAAQP
ncbi:MAG: cytochrome P450 [Polyangiaceae bacterium]